MIRRILVSLVALAMVFSLLGGCTSNGGVQTDSTTSDGVQTDATTSEVESEPTEEGDDPSLYSGEIVVSSSGGTGSEQGWQEVIEAYKLVQPNVKINLELKPSEFYGEWLQKEMSAGDVRADIVSGGPQQANGDWMDFYEYTNRLNPYTGAPWGDSIDMSLQKFVSPNGALEIIATDGIKTLLLYNADKFDELGLQPPETWDDLINVSEEILTGTDYIPISIGGDENSFTFGVMSWLLIIYGDQYTRDRIQYNRAQPGDYNYDEEIDGIWEYDPTDPYNDYPLYVTQNHLRVFANFENGTCSQNTPETRRVIENLGKVFPKYAPPGYFGIDNGSGYALFLQGKSLMYFGATWDIPTLYNDLENLDAAVERMKEDGREVDEGTLRKFDFKTVPYPSMSDDLAQAPVRGFEGAAPNFSVVRKDKEHNDMVMDFVMFYTTGINYTKYLQGVNDGGGTPSGIIIIKDAEMPEPYEQIMGDIGYGDGSVNDFSTILFRGGNNMGSIPEYAREVYNYTKNYLEGSITIDDWGELHQQNVIANYDKLLEIFQINKADLETPEKEPTN